MLVAFMPLRHVARDLFSMDLLQPGFGVSACPLLAVMLAGFPG